MRLLSFKVLVLVAAFLAPSARDPGRLVDPIAQTAAGALDGVAVPIDADNCQFWPDSHQADADNNGNGDVCVCAKPPTSTPDFARPLCDVNYSRCGEVSIE